MAEGKEGLRQQIKNLQEQQRKANVASAKVKNALEAQRQEPAGPRKSEDAATMDQ